MQARAATAYADLVTVDQLVRAAASTDGARRRRRTRAARDRYGRRATRWPRSSPWWPAACEAGVPTRVYSVSLGGFDTHAEERAGHERLLRQLDEALTGVR